MSYRDNDGCVGCFDVILFLVIIVFAVFLLFKGCTSCANEAYRSFKTWHGNNTKEQKSNYTIPQNQDSYYQNRTPYHQSNPTRTKKLIIYTMLCPNCEGKGLGSYCKVCKGRGVVKSKCFRCGGSGKSCYLTHDGDRLLPVKGICNECNGTGVTERPCLHNSLDKCKRCKGTGRITITEEEQTFITSIRKRQIFTRSLSILQNGG